MVVKLQILPVFPKECAETQILIVYTCGIMHKLCRFEAGIKISINPIFNFSPPDFNPTSEKHRSAELR